MSALEKEVTKYMITTDTRSSEAIEATKSLVKIVNEKSIQDNLLQLIQALGEYLTSEDEFIRAKATGLLSTTLADCQQNAITEHAVSVLVSFYCERLTDQTCVANLLDGLVALVHYENFTGKNAIFVAKRIIQDVSVQQFPQSTRDSAYKLFNQLIIRHATALKNMNNDFVYGFCQALDGEKDPRNLMNAFQIMKKIVDNFDISTHVEDIFEVTFCYFPITFKPPPDDPYGITAEDLKSSLRQCISSTPLFAKFALPLILEKLSSTSGSAKKDSMETLAACAPVYGASALLPNMTDIFANLKLEVFHAIDAPLEDAAVEAIRAVVAALNVDITDADGLKPIIDECATNLKDPDMKNSKQTGRILRAAASASESACRLVTDSIVPLVLKQYRETNVTTLKKANIDIILDLLEACKTLYGSAVENENDTTSFTNPLTQHKDRFFSVFESSLLASNEYNLLRLSGLRGLKLMILLKGYLTSNEIGLAIQSINKILLDEQDEELCSAALETLEVASHINSKYIIENTLPALINRLPDTFTDTSFGYTLYSLRVLAPVPTVYEHAMPMLIKKFDTVCEKDEKDIYARAIIESILEILKVKSEQKHSDIAQGANTFIPHFLKKVIEASLSPTASHTILQPQILDALSLSIIIIFSKADGAVQKIFVDKIFKLFREGDLTQFNIVSTQPFKPLDASSSNEQQCTSQLFAAIVCALRKDVVLPVPMEDYLNETMNLALASDNRIQVKSAARIMGSLINKWNNNAALAEYVKTTAAILEDAITQKPNSNMLEVYLWITKALVLRTNALGYELTDKVIEWCGDNNAGLEAPQGFDILIGDDELALNKNTFATTTILYKQRFFSFCLPKLVEGFKSAAEDIKPRYLIALSHVLRNVPKQILLNELPPLVPLLIQSLSLHDSTLKVSTLETFKLAISEAADVVGPQVHTILPPLLDLLTDGKPENTLRVRVAALTCLSQFPAFISKDALVPHLGFVLKALKKPLDDKKRMVRKEAVDCRAQWYTMGN